MGTGRPPKADSLASLTGARNWAAWARRGRLPGRYRGVRRVESGWAYLYVQVLGCQPDVFVQYGTQPVPLVVQDDRERGGAVVVFRRNRVCSHVPVSEADESACCETRHTRFGGDGGVAANGLRAGNGQFPSSLCSRPRCSRLRLASAGCPSWKCPPPGLERCSGTLPPWRPTRRRGCRPSSFR